MNDPVALAEIRRLATLDRIRFRHHASERMEERDARPEDIRHALVGATNAVWQLEHRTWKVSGGTDLEGDDLTCAVDIEDDVIVVTLF